MTATRTGALEAMLEHHAALLDGVSRRIATLAASAAGGRFHPAAAELVGYLAAEVLPHAQAEELTVYRAAAARGDLAETIAAMIGEHRLLAASIERLATADEARAAIDEAKAIGSLFASHVAKENELVLPPLAADEDADLSGLLSQMHHLLEGARAAAPDTEDLPAPDLDARLLRFLLEAADALAGAGEGDQACRLVARAWATLRSPRPDLSVALSAALHRLARSVTAEPVTLSTRAFQPTPDSPGTLDVRSLAPAQRHERIFATYAALAPGTSFVLVNDHDPKPLRYQFEAEHPTAFTWDYLEAGPRTWRVRIGRQPGSRSR